MQTSARPRRSVLYMPGANPRALEKAKSLVADALILDLEDSVAPEGKVEARTLVAATVSAGGYGKREIVIRTNALSTPWGRDDIAAAVAAKPDALLVPKIDDPETVAEASKLMDAHGAAPGMALWAMMETPIAMLRAREIAAAAQTTRLACFIMGTNDLAKDLHCAHTPTREPMLTSLGLSLLAARAYGLTIVDGVFNDIKDMDGFVQICRQGRDMGFDGKTLIHPDQLDPCNRIFRPTERELEEARKIIAAFDLPENKGKGVVKVDGRMVELLHAENARRIVAMAAAIEALEAA